MTMTDCVPINLTIDNVIRKDYDSKVNSALSASARVHRKTKVSTLFDNANDPCMNNTDQLQQYTLKHIAFSADTSRREVVTSPPTPTTPRSPMTSRKRVASPQRMVATGRSLPIWLPCDVKTPSYKTNEQKEFETPTSERCLLAERNRAQVKSSPNSAVLRDLLTRPPVLSKYPKIDSSTSNPSKVQTELDETPVCVSSACDGNLPNRTNPSRPIYDASPEIASHATYGDKSQEVSDNDGRLVADKSFLKTDNYQIFYDRSRPTNTMLISWVQGRTVARAFIVGHDPLQAATVEFIPPHAFEITIENGIVHVLGECNWRYANGPNNSELSCLDNNAAVASIINGHSEMPTTMPVSIHNTGTICCINTARSLEAELDHGSQSQHLNNLQGMTQSFFKSSSGKQTQALPPPIQDASYYGMARIMAKNNCLEHKSTEENGYGPFTNQLPSPDYTCFSTAKRNSQTHTRVKTERTIRPTCLED